MTHKRALPLPFLIFLIAVTLPILYLATRDTTTDPRSLAQASPTPTATPTLTPTITPTPTNTPPRCDGISVHPGSGTVPLTVTFTCAGYDPDNDITAAEFGFGGDAKKLVEKSIGQFGAISTTYTYTEPGTYRTTCRVRDNNMAYSAYPSYCTYTVTVVRPSPTPEPEDDPETTPYPTVRPTAILTPTINPAFTTPDTTPAALPTLVISAAPVPDEEPSRGFWTNEKFAQLAMMVIISGVTVIIALLLHEFFERR